MPENARLNGVGGAGFYEPAHVPARKRVKCSICWNVPVRRLRGSRRELLAQIALSGAQYGFRSDQALPLLPQEEEVVRIFPLPY